MYRHTDQTLEEILPEITAPIKRESTSLPATAPRLSSNLDSTRAKSQFETTKAINNNFTATAALGNGKSDSLKVNAQEVSTAEISNDQSTSSDTVANDMVTPKFEVLKHY